LTHLNKFHWLLLVAFVITTINTAVSEGDVSCYHCHGSVVRQFRNNVHYPEGITCADCHGGKAAPNESVITVKVMSSNDFIGRPSRHNITKVCSKCHVSEAEDYKRSIHWKQIEAGHLDAATCTDCHGIHDIRAIDDPNASTNPLNEPRTCAKCHSNREMMSAWYYGIKTDRFDTYKESYHWKALSKGYTVVATCSDCHENHATLPPTDPNSSTYPDNLPKTCGKKGCHPGVSFDVKAAIGLVHDKESIHTSKLVFNKSGMDPKLRAYYLGPFDLAYWIALFFKILTTGVLGTFGVMVLLDFLSRVKIHRRW